MTKTYNESKVMALAEFLVKYQKENDGSAKAMPTAINEAKERIVYEDYRVRPQNSVDGKEHVWTPSK